MPIRDRCITVDFAVNCRVKAIQSVYQYDHGLQLKVTGIDTSKIYQQQYAFDGQKNALTVVPTIESDYMLADIPDVLQMQYKEIRCYIYLEENSSGYTVYEIHIPVIPRAKPSDANLTPGQIDNYNKQMEQLNELMTEVNDIKDELVEITNDAESATDEANKAADRLSEVELQVEMLPPSSDPTANVTQTETKTTFELGIPTSNLAYSTFFVSMEDGCLYMLSPDGFSDVNFFLSENGEIFLEINS